MLRVLVSTASQWLDHFNRSVVRERGPGTTPRSVPMVAGTPQPLKRVLLTDEVAHTLFQGFGDHRAAARGEEETGWVLMGLRGNDEALVMATLPAGAQRDASAVHVRFNWSAQAVGSRILRQGDRRLTILGVVHTHPGSLRHPSDGDFQGDSTWVGQLRGGEGVFGIGTADASPKGRTPGVAYHPRAHVHCLGELRFSWYSLRKGDRGYRPIPVELTLGPDLARPLHPLWNVLEAHAEQLERLQRQQAQVHFELIRVGDAPALAVDIGLSEPGQSLRVLLTEEKACYYLVRDGELLVADCGEERVDRAVYLLLADLAA